MAPLPLGLRREIRCGQPCKYRSLNRRARLAASRWRASRACLGCRHGQGERSDSIHEIRGMRVQLAAAQQRVIELELQRTQIIWDWVAKALKFPEPEPSDSVLEHGDVSWNEAPSSSSSTLPSSAILQLGPEIGCGSFGNVFKACNLITKEVEAVKLVAKSSVHTPEQLAALQREFSITRDLPGHPNIARMLAPMLTDRHLLVRMEYVGAIDLQQVLQQAAGAGADALENPTGLDVADALRYFLQACRGAAHLHQGGICHLDIKPANLVLDDSVAQAKLVDFGLARHLRRPIRRMCGTLPYIAPEVMHSAEFDGAAADVWSLGSTLSDLLRGLRSVATAMGWSDTACAKPSPSLGRELAQQLQEPRGLIIKLIGIRRLRAGLDGGSQLEKLPPRVQNLLATTLCADPLARACSRELSRLEVAE